MNVEKKTLKVNKIKQKKNKIVLIMKQTKLTNIQDVQMLIDMNSQR